MKSKEIKNKFKGLLEFDNQSDKIEHDSKMIMFKFLSIVEFEMEQRDMNKKQLAEILGTSPSYVSQLFTGTKTINLLTLAKLQNVFNIEFEITPKINKVREKVVKRISPKQRTRDRALA